jgi:hypothetical protein
VKYPIFRWLFVSAIVGLIVPIALVLPQKLVSGAMQAARDFSYPRVKTNSHD